MDIKNSTPSQIDEKLAEIYGEIHKLAAANDSDQKHIDWMVKRGATSDYDQRQIEQAENRIVERHVEMDDLLAEAKPFEAEYVARGRWTRFFLCEHVHSSQSCHTLRPTSRIGWLPQLSGMDETETVDKLGEAACTICYPSAPVNKPNTIELDPAKAARKVEREARAAELAAKRAATAITFEDGSPVQDRLPGTSRYYSPIKTERTALIAAVDALVYVQWGYGGDHAAYFEYLLPALAFKAGRPAEELRAELVAKAVKKAKQ